MAKIYEDLIRPGTWYFASDSKEVDMYTYAEDILRMRKKYEPEYQLPATLISPQKGGKGIDKGQNLPQGGCYIATSVYGSYNCPQVWVLRRFRDGFLSKYLLGRTFIDIYYKVSPYLVERYGKCKMFISLSKPCLDYMVTILLAKGYSSKPYTDK